jgi:hypothetical protein
MCTRTLFVVLALAASLLPLRAVDTLIITEFSADDNGINALRDEDGNTEDWIEIHNPSTNTVSLAGWYLTDFAPNIVKWQFPATNIGPNGYMIIWASEKDRRIPGRPLHTNFKLDAGGEYVGLIRPDLTVSSEYPDPVPLQIPNVSYGLPVLQTSTVLVPTGAVARVYIPTNDVLASSWIASAFDDSSWLPAVTGVGYETDIGGPFTPQVVANSVTEFSGKQGSNNWYYGYWDRAADGNGSYQDYDMSFFPNVDGPFGANNFWTGSNWTWFAGQPPFTQITAQGATPNASNGIPGRAEHVAIRRYLSEHSGLLKITGQITHTGDWVYVTQTGVAANSSLYVYLTAIGDGYIDDMKIVAGSVPEVGANLLPNGDFESALTGPWTVSANHAASAITTAVKKTGNSSLYINANAGGTTQASAIWQNIAPALTVGATYTISYWYKPTSNNTPLVVRFSGNWINTSPTPCGDGVTGRIFVDGNEVFSLNALQNSPTFTTTVPVNLGSRVDFALDPRTNDFCDASSFTVQLETANPGDITVANSVDDWSTSGTQGEKNWTYGYYNRTTDPGGVYATSDFIPFPRSNVAFGPANWWTGTIWDVPAGNPPWSEIGQTGMHPNGINNGAEHWVIRRWASEVSGALTVDWTVAKTNPNGNGVTGRVFHNGVQVDSVVIAGNNSAGVARSVVITNVSVGDFIDIALDPTGIGGDTGDGSDGSAMTAVIRGSPTLTSSIATSIQSAMKGVNSSAYIRIPFEVTNSSAINFLSLRMRYDDGFVAYLNGVQIATRNTSFFPDPVTWNSVATTNRADADVNSWEDIDVTPFAGLLQPGTNLLAIHGLNVHPLDSDFLILPELRALTVSFGTNAGYFSTPTPGFANGNTSTNLGPIIFEASHTPNEPLDNQNLTVLARVTKSFNNVSNVTMVYRVAYGSEVSVPMLDNGLNGDGAAGDGVYGATIPASASTMGQMVRYFIMAQDIKTNNTRFPPYTDPLIMPQYFGTVVLVPQTNSLPIIHTFMQNPAATETDAGGRGSVFFNGQFRDNVEMTLHGQSSAGFPRKSQNINLNPGYKMTIKEGTPDVSDFAILSTWADRTHVRNNLNIEIYEMAGGAPPHFAIPVRIHRNEAFHMVGNIMEQGDEEYLERIGYDPNGALYKMYNTFTGAAGNEKKTRRTEGTEDLQNLYNAISTVNPDAAGRTTYLWDNVNLPNVIDFLAAKAIGSDHDCCHKNYYYYRDSAGSGEWYALPWDFDLSIGHVWTNGPAYFSDTIITNLFIGVGNNNTMFALMWANPELKSMWMRRTRTLMDTILQAPGTSTNVDILRNRLDYWAGQVRADSAIDKAKWGGASWTAPHYGPANPTTADPTNNFEIEVTRIKDFYLQGRRNFMYLPAILTANGIPNAQPTNVTITFGALDYSPSTFNQAEEYIELINTNTFPVDLSGWKIKGAVEFTFAPGTVVTTTNRIYVTPDLKAFRARATSPRAGQRRFAVGPYKGQLSARGETLVLINPAGQTNSSITYVGAPSLAQQYLRITEIMYAPPLISGAPYAREEYEYLELKNIGPVPINLTSVHFTNGIDFTFTSATRTNLQPGEVLILAKNLAAFAQRYPAVTNVTGPYIGTLDNSGETIRLDDAVGEKILDFAYNNSWYPMTDGNGLSLVIVNENAPFNTWGDKASWRPSGIFQGTPGTGDAAPVAFAPILVNEVLTHTDLPTVDYIELYNPTTNDVNIGNWLISDDFFTPRKFRIPNPTTITAGGYLVFTEADFNVGPNSFSFSSHGDEAYLFSGDSAGNPNGYFHGYDFDGGENAVTFGRYTNSQGEVHFVAQSVNTPNAANALPKVGPVVISEIMYHPPDLVIGTNFIDIEVDEYVELHNITGSAVQLYDPAFPTNRWQLKGGVDFIFSTNHVIASNGYLVVVSFNPTNTALLTAFRNKYGTPTNVPIVGPWSGKLDNSGENISLFRPDSPDESGTALILVERVDYADVEPWDVIADGFGASLNRIVSTSYGNDPTNFLGAAASPGVAPVGGTPPQITQQPTSASVFVLGTTNFTAHVSGSGLVYQWLFNGNLIYGATGPVLTLTNIQYSQAGQYSYLAFNGAGYVASSNATLAVVTPVYFSVQPASQNVQPGTNVTITAQAVGTGTINYQWRFNGVNIPNATNSSYSFVNANLNEHHGDFSVVVVDDISTAVSDDANIFVMVRPGIVQHIFSQSVLQGSSVTLSLVATGAPPLWYRWIRGGSAYATTSVPSIVITNFQATTTFRVGVTNVAAPAGVFSPTAGNITLTLIPDGDGDGLADAWEIAYFGSTNAGNATLDSDGDLMTNADEYRAGTNPTNALSLLKVLFTQTNANVLSFVAQTNVSYSVQWRTNLTAAPWFNLTNLFPSNQVRTITVDSGTAPPGTERYFRVVTPLVP